MPTTMDMILFCPRCHLQHVDAPDASKNWDNPPHKSHLCKACGTIWRPADVETNGVLKIETRGAADTWPAIELQRDGIQTGESQNIEIDWPFRIPPVDRSQRVLSSGMAVTEDHREIDPKTGQQKGYVVLTQAERSKGFVRPVRKTYRHLTCGTVTTMAQPIAETYARDPGFYNATFCCACKGHFALGEFVWDGTNDGVGS